MKNALKSAFAFCATLIALVVVTLAAAAFVPPLSPLENTAALNTAGDHVYASLQVADATGITTTVTTASTFYPLQGTLFAAGETDGSNCLTATPATGRITVAAACGRGGLELEYCGNDIIGANAATIQAAFHRIRGGTTTLIGPTTRRTEGATAARGTLGCLRTLVSAQVGDTYEVRYTSGVNGETVVTRAAQLTAMKVLN